MYYNLLKPSKFDFNLPTPLSKSEVEQFRVFTHYLILQNFYSNFKFKERKFTEIYSKFLEQEIFNSGTHIKIFDWYKDGNFYLLVNDSYDCVSTNKKCKGYRLNFFGEFEVDSYSYEFKSPINERKFKALFNKDTPKIMSDFERENDEKQLGFIRNLEFDEHEYYRVLPKIIKKYKEENEVGLNYLIHLKIQENECYNFSIKKGFSKYDDFSNRYYNFFTNKSSLLRACFKLDGQFLGTSDISNSQPYFFTQLPKIDFSEYEFIDPSKIAIERRFKKLVKKGMLYTFFAKRLNLTKKQTKLQILSFFYGDTRYKRLEQLIQRYFPHTFETLKYLQNIETNDPKFNFIKKSKVGKEKKSIETPKQTYFNYLLQNIERNIFLKAFEDMEDFYTVHDSVYYEANRREEFEKAIYNHFEKLGLDKPKLKFEIGYI